MLAKAFPSWIGTTIGIATGLLTRLVGGNLVVLIHVVATRDSHRGGPPGWGFALLCVVVLVRLSALGYRPSAKYNNG